MIGKDRDARFLAIVGHGEAECSFRRKPEINFLPWKQYSSA